MPVSRLEATANVQRTIGLLLAGETVQVGSLFYRLDEESTLLCRSTGGSGQVWYKSQVNAGHFLQACLPEGAEWPFAECEAEHPNSA